MNPDLQKWLEGRPPVIRELAKRFPPGSYIRDHVGTKLWVCSYGEDGSVKVSETNPGEDYEKAMLTRKTMCACCAKGEKGLLDL